MAQSSNDPEIPFSFLLPRWDSRVLALILFIIAVIFYANTFKHGYAVDDKNVIQQNEYTLKGLAGIPDILSKDSFRGFYKDNRARIGNYYRPLPLITYALERQFLKEKPGFSHFLNVLFYGATAVALWVLFSQYFFPARREWAFFGVLFFIIHPIHTEVVANIKSRDEIFSLLFLTLTLIYALKSARELKINEESIDNKNENKFYINVGLSALFYALALFSKENGLTFLAILPLTLYFFGDLKPRQIVKVSLPFLLSLGVYFAMRVGVAGLSLAQNEAAAYNANDVLYNRYAHVGFVEKYATSVVVLGKYLLLLLFPHPLSWDYSYNAIPFYTFAAPYFWLSLGVYAALTLWGLYSLKTKNPLGYAVLFYLLSVFLVSNLLVNIGGYVGERFLYQPSVGFALFLAGVIFVSPIKILGTETAQKIRPLIAGLTALIFFASFAKTYTRNQDWKDNESICKADVETVPQSAKASAAAGNTYIGLALIEGTPAKTKEENLRLGVKYLGRAVEILPKWQEVYRDLGMGQALLKDYSAAEKSWLTGKSLAKEPVLRDAYDYNLSTMYMERSTVAQTAGDYKVAIEWAEKALSFSPKNDRAWDMLGKAYFQLGDFNKAIEYFEKATQLNPTYIEYTYDLAVTYFNVSRKPEAKALFDQILQKQPNHPGAQNARKLFN